MAVSLYVLYEHVNGLATTTRAFNNAVATYMHVDT